MYKTLCVAAILLATLALTSISKSADASASIPTLPLIVAKGKLANQTAPIPTTTIFTPKQDGLFRLSVYATVSKADPSSGSSWEYNLQYTDDGGPQALTDLLAAYNNFAAPFSYENFFINVGGPALTFEAKAGTPVTYSVTLSGPPDDSAYSLYYTLERLE